MPVDEELIAKATKWKEERETQKLNESLGLALEVDDPSTARRAETVSQQTGVPFTSAESDIETAETNRTRRQMNIDAMRLQQETPGVALWMADPKQARMTVDDLEGMKSFELAQRRKGSYWKNVGLGMGERANTLTGNLIQFAGTAVSGYEMMAEQLGLAEEGSLNLSEKMDYLGKAISEGGLGYEQQYSWEDLKGEPSVANLAGYVMETGAQSFVDIAGMMATLPAYLASRTQEIAESRTENAGGGAVDPMELVKSVPTAVAVTLIDRLSAKGALGMLGNKLTSPTLRAAAGEIAKRGAVEGLTEFVQEQVEYVGETMGTGAEMSVAESLDRGFAGMVAGGPMGGAMRAATLPFDAVELRVQQNFEKDLGSVNEQQSLDGMISSILSMKLNQEAPDVARQFFKDMDPDDRVYISPEGIQAAMDAGLTVPTTLQDQMGSGQDVSLTVDSFALDIIGDEQLTEALRPHMKRSADSYTQFEIQNRDSSQLERLMNLAKEDKATRTEADDIHDEVVSQLVASGRLAKGTAEMSAQIIPAYVTTKVTELQGRGIEVTARDIYEEMNFRIKPAEGAVDAPAKPPVYESSPEVQAAPKINSLTDTTAEIVVDGDAETTDTDTAVETGADTDTAVEETQTEEAPAEPKKGKNVKIQHANPRIDMYFKEVTKRIPELTEAAKQVADGSMTPEEYSRLVNEYKPVTPYESVPTPATVDEVSTSLDKGKQARIGAPMKSLEEGHEVGVRLDIPAYTRHGTWVVSVHEKGSGFKAGKSIGYESVALVTDATLGAHEGISQKIATGSAKSTIAVVKGKWKKISVEESIEMANNALSDPAYVQVGYDPERHSYFYDRATMEPIVGAVEVLQVGPLTLAKNPTYGDSSDFLYQAEVDLTGDNVTLKSITSGEKIDGIPEKGKVTASMLATRLDELIAEEHGGPLRERTEENKAIIVETMKEEVKWALSQSGNGADWYSTSIESAMHYAALIHPELQTDPEALVIFKLAMAISSNMADVESNSKHAEEVYSYYKKKKKFPIIGWSTTIAANKGHFKLMNSLISGMGMKDTVRMLENPITVRDLAEFTGITVSGELQDTVVNGSMILGPKLGAFYQNLSGNYDPITMDRWFMKTWGRWTGTNMPIREDAMHAESKKGDKSSTRAAKFRAAIKALPPRTPGINKALLMKDDDALLELAKEYRARYARSKYKDKSDINKTAKNLYEAVNDPVIEPGNGSNRNWIREVSYEGLAQLKAEGIELNAATFQALVWYLEKDLYVTNGVGSKKTEATDYEEEFRRLATARLGESEVESNRPDSAKSKRGSKRRSDTGTEPTAPPEFQKDESSLVLNQSDVEKARQDKFNEALAELESLGVRITDDVEFDLQEISETAMLDAVNEQTSYKGRDAIEAVDWIKGVEKFGEEGMTFSARMQRAKEMGFDTENIYYHGTTASNIMGFVLDRFDNGRDFIFVTPDPDFASTFAGYNEGFVPPSGISVGPVYPLLIKKDKLLDHQNLTEDEYNDLHQHIQIELEATGTPGDQLKAGADWRMRAIESGNWEIVEKDSAIQVAIRDMQYTAFTVLEGGDPKRGNNDPDNIKNTAIFDPAHIRSINAVFDPDRANEATILAQKKPGKDAPRGSIEIMKSGEKLIELAAGSDKSTFLHEAGHLFLETEKSLAAKYGLGDNQKAMLKMLGVDSFDAIGVKEHELWARTFEDYLRTGKAPTRGLRAAFLQFSKWLGQIYKSMRQLGLPLNKEITEIFDRMLATEAEIANVAAGAEYEQLFKGKERAGMTDKQWESYQKSLETRKKNAEMTLFEKLLKELGARRSKEWNEEKKPLIAEQKEKLAGQPVYQAMGIMKDLPLDRDAVVAAMGVESLPKKTKLQFLTKKGGDDPELLAEQLGFASVEEMVTAVHNAEGITAAADAAAEEIMVAKYGDMLNDGTIEAEAREAMHNEAQADLMLKELRAIKSRSRKKSTPDVDKEFLKAKAAQSVGTMTYGELKPERFHRAEVRAAQDAARAKTAEAAYDAKLQQIANHYLFLAALKARKDAITYRDYIRGVQKRDYKTTQVDAEYIQSMKRLAKMYDTSSRPKEGKRVKAARDFANWIAGQQRDGVDVNLKDLNVIELRAGLEYLPTFDEMTLEQLESVSDQLKHLRFVGGQIAAEDKGPLSMERNAMLAQLEEMGESKSKADWEASSRHRMRGWIQHAIHLVPSLRNMIRDLGDGAFFDSVYRRISNAENAKLNILEDFYGKLDELFADADLTGIADSSASVRSVTKEDGSKWHLSARQRFMLAAYWGTDTSQEAVRKGFDVTDNDVMRMMEQMSEQELDMVQSLWELSDHMKTPLFQATHDREGVAPPLETHMPFTVNGKTMRGGHMTLIYGGSGGDIDAKVRLDEDPLNTVNSLSNSKATAATARSGSGGRKPLLEVQNIYRVIEENAHYIAYATTATELQSLFNDKEVRTSLADKFGEGFDKAMMQSIQGLTTNLKEQDPIPALAAIIRQIRYSKSMMYLAYNVKNIMQQVASVLPSMAEMGPINYSSASLAFHGNFAENRAFVEEKSAQMRARKAHLNREAADLMKRVESGSKAEAALNKFAQHGFTPHVMLDMVVSYPTWLATYSNEMTKHGDEELAILNADVTVAETIGSGMDLHLGKIFRSNEAAYMKMLTVFGSWFNSSIFQRAYRNTRGGKEWMSIPAFEALVLTPMLTMVLSEVIAMNIPKLDDDERDDEFPLKVAKWLGLGYTGFMGATIPIFGDLLPGQSNFKPSTLMDDAIGTVQQLPSQGPKLLEAVTNPSWANTAETLENFIKVAGTFIALPGSGNVVRMLDYTKSALEGNEKAPETIPEVVGAALQPFVEGRDKN
jgi:hypothetical protein